MCYEVWSCVELLLDICTLYLLDILTCNYFWYGFFLSAIKILNSISICWTLHLVEGSFFCNPDVWCNYEAEMEICLLYWKLNKKGNLVEKYLWTWNAFFSYNMTDNVEKYCKMSMCKSSPDSSCLITQEVKVARHIELENPLYRNIL